MSNNEFITKLEGMVHSQIDFVVKELQNKSNEELKKKSNEREWSISECIEHLNTYGNYYLPLINQRIIVNVKQNSILHYKSKFPGNYLNKLIYPGSKIKFKARLKHVPHVISPYLSIANHLNQQEELLKLLRASNEIDLTKNKIPISIFKLLKLPLGDIFEFLVYHTERHLIQASNVTM